MKTLVFQVTGTAELLMNNPAKMTSAPSGVGTQKIPTPEAEAESGAYRLPNGQLYAPRSWVRACLLGAAIGLRIGKKSAPGVISSSVFSAGALELPLRDPETKAPIMEYEIDRRRAVVKSGVQKNGVIRCRPLVRKWETIAAVEIDPILIAEENLEEIFRRAGQVCGWGDFRVSCKGELGRFAVKRLE